VKVLGIDPGTRITGYAIVEKIGNEAVCIKSGIIDIKKTVDISEKLLKLYNETVNLIELFKPESIALEDIFYYKNVKSTIKLAYAKGVIFLAAARNGMEVFEYTPTNVKCAVTGSGRAPKDSVIKLLPHLVENLPDNFRFQDESDAIALAYCHLMTNSFEETFKVK